jgi:hypothetical protein
MFVEIGIWLEVLLDKEELGIVTLVMLEIMDV